MRLKKINRRDNAKRFWTAMILSALAVLLIIISGCSEDLDGEDECLADLDDKNFSAVADNPDCSIYERASAHMGLAGFLFANFLKENASDNFRVSLGIPPAEKKWEGTPRKRHYEQARRLTGESAGDYYETRPRPMDNAEIHLFASLASIISEAYIKFDITPDGKITEEEIEDFVNILPVDTSGDEDGLTVDVSMDLMVFARNMSGDTIPFLIRPKKSIFEAGCVQKDPSYDYSGVYSENELEDLIACGLFTDSELVDLAGLGEDETMDITGNCMAIAKVKELKFFENNNVGEVADKVMNLAGNLFPLVDEVSADLNALNISQDSELRKNLDEFDKDFVQKLDNGGVCEAGKSSILDSLEWGKAILAKVSKEPTSDYRPYYITFDDLKTEIKKKEIPPLEWKTKYKKGEVYIDLTLRCVNEEATTDSLKIGLTFARGDDTSDGYIPYYGKCDATNDYCCDDGKCGVRDSIQTSLITLDTITNKMASDSSADDREISFKEMICFDPSSDIL